MIMASTLKLYHKFALAHVTIGHILSTFISNKLQREAPFRLIIKLSSWESEGKSGGKVGAINYSFMVLVTSTCRKRLNVKSQINKHIKDGEYENIIRDE